MNILLTHKDLDGAACAVVASLSRDPYEIRHCDYNDIDKTFEWALRQDFEKIIVADISPSADALAALDDKRVVILDHHKNSAWAAKWGTWRGRTGAGMFDESKCGARLLLEWIKPSLGLMRADQCRQLIDVVEAWDLWRCDSLIRPDAERLQRLFAFMGMERFVETYADRCRSCFFLFSIAEQEITAILEERAYTYIQARVGRITLSIDSEGRTFAWTIANRETSEIGNRLAELSDAEYGAVYVPEHNKVELRSIDSKADVGKIAKSRGGGGHHNASGYPVSVCPFPEL